MLGLARTPFVPILGSLAEESSVALASVALKGALNSGFTPPNLIDKLILSQVFTSGVGASPSKQVANTVGLKDSTRCFQTSQLCTSGLKAISLANDLIQTEKSHLVAAVGSESSSQAPFLLKKARMNGYGVGDGALIDSLTYDGFSKLHMDVEEFMQNAGLSKLAMTQYAAEAFQRTASCYSDGIMRNEMVHVTVEKSNKEKAHNDVWISHRQVKLTEDVLYKTFVPNQASPSNIKTKSTMADGAACVLLSGGEILRGTGAVPIARIVDCCEVSAAAAAFPCALVSTIKEIQTRTNNRVDIYDILDQYAFIPMFVAKELGIDQSRINIHGSTLAIGHPMGASGVRQLIAMVTALRSHGLQFGCVAGVNMMGDSIAILVEAV